MIQWMKEHPVHSGYWIARDGTVIGRMGRALKPSDDGAGYKKIVMCLPGNRRKTVRVHSLVCETYHGARPSSRHAVAHKDGNRGNNHADNLRWATYEENEADKAGHGTRLIGERHHAAKLTDEIVREARAIRLEGVPLARIASRFGVTHRTIQQAISGETWGHVK